jgi:hypothetical protein
VPCPDDRLARVIQCHLTGRVLYAIANPKQVIVQTMGVGLGTGAMVHIFRKTLRAASVFLDLEFWMLVSSDIAAQMLELYSV